MRLGNLIVDQMESILQDFENFARTHTESGGDMDVAALRDHAEAILRAFAADMEQPQTDAEQRSKSQGDAPPADPRSDPTAAELHGHLRADSGFSLQEMFAEYRALRASVLRHWMASRKTEPDDAEFDMIRFNEAMDQAVAESIGQYTETVDEYRETFVAVLGHDLRTPLSAVLAAAEFLAESIDSPRGIQLAQTIQRSGERMNNLIADMLDFTLSRLGQGIPVERSRVDLKPLVREVVEEARLLHPDREFRFEAVGELIGHWDGPRLAQALANLIANAIQHGSGSSAITVVLRGEADEAIVAVRNRGHTIPADKQAEIFEPFRRGMASAANGTRSMGLGLHIAQQIAMAHGGRIDVASSRETGTTFSFHLPRNAPT